MKVTTSYGAAAIVVYTIELCFYGDRGDYEVFPDRELSLALDALTPRLAASGMVITHAEEALLLFTSPDRTEYTLYRDGRMIIEGLKPGSHQQAWEAARNVLDYGDGI